MKEHSLVEQRLLTPPAGQDILCIILVRNEILRLPNCLEHYRSLGVDRFIILDNDSRDGTAGYLSSTPDVDIWRTSDFFSESKAGMIWRHLLVGHYGFNRWYLIVDADELLVYQEMGQRDLHDVARRLEKLQLKSLRAPMIDMYSDRPLGELNYLSGSSLVAACPYFDGDSYRIANFADGSQMLEGGPRVRLVSKSSEEEFNHSLEKYPFRFWAQEMPIIGIHSNPFPNQRVPPMGALLHFKFLQDLKDKIQAAIEEKQHWKGSVEYESYDRAFDSLRSPYYEGSIKYEGPQTLIKRWLITPFPW